MRTATTCILILLGVALVLTGKLLADTLPTISLILENLGVTGATILTVMLIYDRFIARDHLRQFLTLLKSELANFQNPTSTSLRLAIREEFSSTIAYEDAYSIHQIIGTAPNASTFRCIGKSLFYVANRPEVWDLALLKAMHVQLCLLDLSSHTPAIQHLTGLSVDDIRASMRALGAFFATIDPKRHIGSFEIRTHPVMLFDSLTLFTDNQGIQSVTWDLTLGPDVTHKRVFVLDANKPLGTDLANRCHRLWLASTPQLLFDASSIKLDNWSRKLPAQSR